MSLPSATFSRGEFNRRAIQALRVLELDPVSWDWEFVHNVAKLVDARYSLSDNQQLSLYRVVHRHRAQISDDLVLQYASERTGRYA